MKNEDIWQKGFQPRAVFLMFATDLDNDPTSESLDICQMEWLRAKYMNNQ